MVFVDIRLPRRLRRIFSTLILILLCAASATAQNATFAGRDYPNAGFKHIAADFNGDGRLDLAGAGEGVRVMLGNGDGTFRPHVDYSAGGLVQDLAAGDVNSDGRLDLVVTNNDPQIGLTVLAGNGDGTFAAPVSFPNDTGFDSPSIVLTDIDHDNRLDAIVAHEIACFTAPCLIGETISLWLGIGDGTFQQPRQIRVARGPSRITVADFNNDFHPDLGVSAAAGKVSLLLGNGDGTFLPLPEMTIVAGVDNTDIDAGDFNGDNVPDLVVAADADHRTVVLLGNGDGTFRQSASIRDALQERPNEQAIADFNGDGFQDIAIGMGLCCSLAGDGVIGVLYGNGDGTFRTVVRYFVPGFTISNAGGYLIASDLNSDGRPDLATQIRGNNPGLTVMLNTTGRASAPVALGSVTLTPSSVVGSRQAEVNVSLARGAVAPSGSLTLSVSSSRSSVASVPSSVRIIAGMTNVRFRVNTSRVNTPQNVTIAVSINRSNSRMSATLTVTPPVEPLALGSVSVSPSAVFGGRGATGVVTLATGHVAPTGGALVSLTNDNPALVTTPNEVLIPAGQTSASFPISTQQTGLTTDVVITGLYGGVARTATLTVSAPTTSAAISTVSLSPSTVVGGSTQGVRVSVTLDQPAPPERATIALSSNRPDLVRLPPSLQIESGFTSGFADFTTLPVSAPTQVTINATYGNSSQSAVLTLTPATQTGPTLAGLVLNPTTVTGGSNAQGTVTLSAPAPSSTVVNLSTSSALASVPASVTIPAGASAANFNVTTASVTSPASVTVSAVLSGTTRTATLNINPPRTVTDTVSIQRVEYETSKRSLRVEATSTRSDAVLRVFVTSTDQLIGTLNNNGGGRYSAELSVSTNPQSITVRSSLGGSATRTVTVK
jgi:hypothetical protein